MMSKKHPLGFLIPLILSVVTLLTGCVRYDVGINFHTPHQGEIVQHIKLGEQLTSLDRADTKKWLNSIEQRSRQLQGKVKQLNSQEVVLTIPFGNGKELVNKFNQIFHNQNATLATALPADTQDLLQLDSQISIAQSNLILVERDVIELTIDLRALEVLAEQDRVIISPDALADLEFHLNTPWLAHSVSGEHNLEPKTDTSGLVWQLQPGQINHIVATFWLPSPLGLGGAIIIALSLVGFVLKYKHLPGVVASEF